MKLTETALADLLAADLSGLVLGGDNDRRRVLCRPLVRGRVGHRPRRHQAPSGADRGATENTTVVGELLVGLRERGLDITRPILAVLDGAKALVAAFRVRPVAPPTSKT